MRGGVERPVGRGVGDGRVGARGEGYGDGDVVEGDVVVFEFVFDVDLASAVVGWGRPAVDCMDACQRRDPGLRCASLLERGT